MTAETKKHLTDILKIAVVVLFALLVYHFYIKRETPAPIPDNTVIIEKYKRDQYEKLAATMQTILNQLQSRDTVVVHHYHSTIEKIKAEAPVPCLPFIERADSACKAIIAVRDSINNECIKLVAVKDSINESSKKIELHYEGQLVDSGKVISGLKKDLAHEIKVGKRKFVAGFTLGALAREGWEAIKLAIK